VRLDGIDGIVEVSPPQNGWRRKNAEKRETGKMRRLNESMARIDLAVNDVPLLSNDLFMI